MGEAGRKLTIRMPDNPRLRSAEVGRLHLDPGARVRPGSPIMTLVARRREHMVRAPKPGRVVPLVAPGDQVQGGDPLYILNIDETALAEANRDSRELISVEKEKFSKGLTPEAIEPLMRQRTARRDRPTDGFLQAWAKPALAIALYILACFVLLPILNAFGREATAGVLISMAVGCVLFGALIYHLYAPDAGWLPRWTVRMVALSWIGLSAMALFYRPDTPDEITLADAAADAARPIQRLFSPGESEPILTRGVEQRTPVILASGIAAGPVEARPVPDHTAPKSVLGIVDLAPVPHGVSVRGWGRVNPTNGSGDPLEFVLVDLVEQDLSGEVPADVPQASVLAVVDPVQGDETQLAGMPDVSFFADLPKKTTPLDAGTLTAAVAPIAPSAGTTPSVDAGLDGDVAHRTAAVASIGEIAKTRPHLPTGETESWIASAGIPVIESAGGQGPWADAAPAAVRSADADPGPRVAQTVADLSGPVSRPVLPDPAATDWLSAEVPILLAEADEGPKPTTLPPLGAAEAPAGAERSASLLAGVSDAEARPTAPVNRTGDWAVVGIPVMLAVEVKAPAEGGIPQVGPAGAAAGAPPLITAAIKDRSGGVATPGLPGTDRTWIGKGVPVLLSDGVTGPEPSPAPELDLGTDPRKTPADAQVVTNNAGTLSKRTRLAVQGGDWVSGTALAVVEGSTAARAPDPRLPAVGRDLILPLRGASPAAPAPDGKSPDLMLLAMQNAARDGWMLEQEGRVGAVQEGFVIRTREEIAVQLTTVKPDLVARDIGRGAIETADIPSLGLSQMAILEGGLSEGRLRDSQPGIAGRRPATDLADPPSALTLALAPADVPDAPPWQPEPAPDVAERLLVFLFYDDPRLTRVPRVGDPWLPQVSPELSESIHASIVESVNEILEVTYWCAAANDPDRAKEKTLPGGAYRTAMLGDRIRLLQVRVQVAAEAVARLEREVPVFGGDPSGFFHNRMPLFGALPGEAVMDRARAYMHASSNRELDRNTPLGIKGGHYFASAQALAAAMQEHGCAAAIWNGGEGPVNEIGRALAKRIEG